MKVIVTQKQLEQIRENVSKKFSCEKCDHSWKIEKEDKHPYLCHMCGYDSAKEKHNYDELENFWKNYKKEEEVTEKWSEKYKKSINCSNPKGFSQRAHCQGRKKRLKESENIEEIPEENKKILSTVIEFATPEIKNILNDENITITYEIEPHRYSELGFYTIITTLNILDKNSNTIKLSLTEKEDIIDILFDYLSYMGEDQQTETYDYSFDFKKYKISYNLNENDQTHLRLKKYGYDIEKIKQALQMLSQVSESVGEFVPLEFKLYGYHLRKFNTGLPVLILFIDVDTEGGVYNTMSENWHDIGMQLLDIFQMLGIRDERYMRPMYDFKFNKRSLDNITIV
jgi:hypothetical protein